MSKTWGRWSKKWRKGQQHKYSLAGFKSVCIFGTFDSNSTHVQTGCKPVLCKPLASRRLWKGADKLVLVISTDPSVHPSAMWTGWVGWGCTSVANAHHPVFCGGLQPYPVPRVRQALISSCTSHFAHTRPVFELAERGWWPVLRLLLSRPSYNLCFWRWVLLVADSYICLPIIPLSVQFIGYKLWIIFPCSFEL